MSISPLPCHYVKTPCLQCPTPLLQIFAAPPPCDDLPSAASSPTVPYLLRPTAVQRLAASNSQRSRSTDFNTLFNRRFLCLKGS